MYKLKDFIKRLKDLEKEVGSDCEVVVSKDDWFEIAAVEIRNVSPELVESECGEKGYNYGTGHTVISVF